MNGKLADGFLRLGLAPAGCIAHLDDVKRGRCVEQCSPIVRVLPFMIRQGMRLFDGDLVMADSHHMPFKDNTFDALAFITTFEYYKDPVRVIQEAARVARHGIALGMMNKNTPKFLGRRVQQAFGKNPFYVTATFYTPRTLIAIIDKALAGRAYTIEWTCTGLPKWFPVQQWDLAYGDFFGLYVQLLDTDEKPTGLVTHGPDAPLPTEP